MPYADVYLIPIPKKNLAAYKKMARKGCKAWMKHGALGYYETVADDLKMFWPGTPFTKAARCKKGETVLAAWILYKSKAHRNAVNARVFKDPMMHSPVKEMPFDLKRCSFGGFKVMVSA